MIWKITFFFTQFGFTWTETYYLSLSATVNYVISTCIQVAQARAGMNGPQCSITAIRIVNLATPRLSQFVTPGTFSSTGYFTYIPGTDPDQDSAPQFVAIQVKFTGVLGNTCRRYFSGAPEGIVGTKLSGRNLSPLGLWQNALNTFCNTLANVGWSFRYRNQAANQQVKAVVTSAQFPGEIGVSFGQQMIAPVAGQVIRMAFKGFKKVNYRLFGIGGVYQVDPNSPGITASVAPYTYYLQFTPNVQVSNIATLGVGCQLLYGYDGFQLSPSSGQNTSFSVLSANHRKRGVSALSLRGRSRSKP